MADSTGALASNQSFSYDSYGVLLGYTGTPQTNLLYTGEQYDTNAQMYYLRARYYDPLNGRFNQLDPYAGNNQDPQSLHKYLYAHANPVNAIDPEGQFAIGAFVTMAIIGVMLLIIPGCRSRTPQPKPELNHYQDNILTVKINPIFILRKSEMWNRDWMINLETGQFADEMRKASEWWAKIAGIKFKWEQIRTIEDHSVLHLKKGRHVDRAIEKYYEGYPVVLVVDQIEEYTSAMIARNRNGFATARSPQAITIAHEFGHVFIWTYLPHVYGQPKNLLSPGKHHTRYPLDELFLTQEQIDDARKRVMEKEWVINHDNNKN